jgi:hypothetical protein
MLSTIRSARNITSFVFLLLALLVSTSAFAQKNKGSGSSSAPPPKPASAPAQRPAPVHTTPPTGSPNQRPSAGAAAASGSSASRTTNPTTPSRKTPPTTPTDGTGRAATTTTRPTSPPNGPRTEAHPSTPIGKGGVTTKTFPGGATATYRPNGKVSSILANGMTISPNRGGRTVSSERTSPNGAHVRTVNLGRHAGFVDRDITPRGGHPFRSRTYVVNGHAYARLYRGYPYRSGVYYRYVPAFYYGPRFYGWAYAPWGAPVVYSWGWGPWYPAFGYYFSPYATYADASQWLADYAIAANLQSEADSQSGAPDPGDANAPSDALTPETKQEIADEVKIQLAAERDAAVNPQPQSDAAPAADQTPDALDPRQTVFVVYTNLDVTTDDSQNQSCELSPGDVVDRTEDTPGQDNTVEVRIKNSQRNDCRGGSKVRLAVSDLQDMHNHLREQVDDGLAQLAQNQGKNGLPTGPAGTPQANPDGTAQPDLTAPTELNAQQQKANDAEHEVQQAGQGGNGD